MQIELGRTVVRRVAIGPRFDRQRGFSRSLAHAVAERLREIRGGTLGRRRHADDLRRDGLSIPADVLQARDLAALGLPAAAGLA